MYIFMIVLSVLTSVVSLIAVMIVLKRNKRQTQWIDIHERELARKDAMIEAYKESLIDSDQQVISLKNLYDRDYKNMIDDMDSAYRKLQTEYNNKVNDYDLSIEILSNYIFGLESGLKSSLRVDEIWIPTEEKYLAPKTSVVMNSTQPYEGDNHE